MCVPQTIQIIEIDFGDLLAHTFLKVAKVNVLDCNQKSKDTTPFSPKPLSLIEIFYTVY